MSDIKRCEECGSWGVQCYSDTPQEGCGCQRCAAATIRDLERQLAEAQRVPPEAFGDSRYAVGWNDCLAWVRQVRSDAAIAATGGKDALQAEDAWCNQIGEVKDA